MELRENDNACLEPASFRVSCRICRSSLDSIEGTREWILDCKRQEFKELMSAITVSYLMTLQTHGSPIRTVDSEELRRLENAKVDALRVSWDRVFIVNDLPLNEIGNR